MKDLFKKAFYLGVGAAVVTKDKVEELVDELVKRGEASQAEGSKLVDEFMTKAKEQEKAMSQKVKNMVKKNLEDLGIPTRNEIDELKRRIEVLETQKTNV